MPGPGRRSDIRQRIPPDVSLDRHGDPEELRFTVALDLVGDLLITGWNPISCAGGGREDLRRGSPILSEVGGRQGLVGHADGCGVDVTEAARRYRGWRDDWPLGCSATHRNGSFPFFLGSHEVFRGLVGR